MLHSVQYLKLVIITYDGNDNYDDNVYNNDNKNSLYWRSTNCLIHCFNNLRRIERRYYQLFGDKVKVLLPFFSGSRFNAWLLISFVAR